ncbi:uncharacterized protein [Taeniopygia guttata]|uniref:uncharacterized protein isoform X4 n=1 Tax=Taeniopygia guttata TaxID=59729 RepID=UPI003BB8A572
MCSQFLPARGGRAPYTLEDAPGAPRAPPARAGRLPGRSPGPAGSLPAQSCGWILRTQNKQKRKRRFIVQLLFNRTLTPPWELPFLGADACLDAFEEAFSLHLLENQRTTSPESTVPAWSRACREGCPGLLERQNSFRRELENFKESL